MSRSGYVYASESNFCYLWDSIVQRATKGRRGQRLLRDLRDALDAMPEKRLVSGSFERTDGAVCTLGSLGVARGIDMRAINEEAEAGGTVAREAGEAFDIARSLAAEIMHANDKVYETPEQRWVRMRRWVDSRIVDDSFATTPRSS